MERFVRLMTAVLLAVSPYQQAGADDRYHAEVEQFRQRREAELKAEDSWLTLVGLHWLQAGPTHLGADPANEVRLPEAAPARVGVLTLEGDRVRFRAEPNVPVTRDGVPFAEGELKSDAAGGKADVLAVGAIRMTLIRRGERYALRVKDNRSPVRTGFSGLRWYPIDESWHINARFEPSKSASQLLMDTIVGTRESVDAPGFAVFEREGKEYRLEPRARVRSCGSSSATPRQAARPRPTPASYWPTPLAPMAS